MIPETFDFIAGITAQAHALGIEVLVEIHGHYQEQIEIAARVDWVYDFALPPLVLHTLYTRDATHLKRWLDIRPHNAVTVLDTHDGIGVMDVGADRRRRPRGLLRREEIDALVETIHERSRGESRLASGGAASNLDTVPGQLHVLRRARPARRRVPRRARHPVLRSRDSADLLRGAARRRQ